MSNLRARQTAAEIGIRRQFGQTRRRRRMPKQLFPKLVERDYARRLLKLIERVQRDLRPLFDELPRLTQTANATRFDVGEGRRARQLVEATRRSIQDSLDVDELEDLAAELGTRTAAFQRAQLNRQVRAAIGVDLFTAERGVATLVDSWVSENVGEIKTIPNRLMEDVERTVMRAFTSGQNSRDLAKDIERQFAVSRNRARLIARDQIGKLSGQVNAQRQQNLGVTKFTWRTVGDERVRDEHDDLSGRVFGYPRGAPGVGLPGEPIQCRCSAEPVFDDILGGL